MLNIRIRFESGKLQFMGAQSAIARKTKSEKKNSHLKKLNWECHSQGTKSYYSKALNPVLKWWKKEEIKKSKKETESFFIKKNTSFISRTLWIYTNRKRNSCFINIHDYRLTSLPIVLLNYSSEELYADKGIYGITFGVCEGSNMYRDPWLSTINASFFQQENIYVTQEIRTSYDRRGAKMNKFIVKACSRQFLIGCSVSHNSFTYDYRYLVAKKKQLNIITKVKINTLEVNPF